MKRSGGGGVAVAETALGVAPYVAPAAVTLASSNGGGTAASDWLIIDLGGAQSVSQVTYYGAQAITAGVGLGLYTSGNATDTPGSGSTALIDSSPALAAGGGNIVRSLAAPVTTRYLLVLTQTNSQNLGTFSAEISGVETLGNAVAFGVIEEVSFEAAYQRKELHDAAASSVFAIDSADDAGRFTIKAKSGTIFAAGLQSLIGAAAAQVASPTPLTLLTLLESFHPGAMAVSCTLTSTDGRQMAIQANQARPRGETYAMRASDYATVEFELECTPDAAGSVAVITAQN